MGKIKCKFDKSIYRTEKLWVQRGKGDTLQSFVIDMHFYSDKDKLDPFITTDGMPLSFLIKAVENLKVRYNIKD